MRCIVRSSLSRSARSARSDKRFISTIAIANNPFKNQRRGGVELPAGGVAYRLALDLLLLRQPGDAALGRFLRLAQDILRLLPAAGHGARFFLRAALVRLDDELTRPAGSVLTRWNPPALPPVQLF